MSRLTNAKEKRMSQLLEQSIDAFGEIRALELLEFTRTNVVPHVNWGVVTMFPIVLQIELEFPTETEEVVARAVEAQMSADAANNDLLNALIGIIRIERARSNG